ncbi:hypothetical protein mRhiFer1_007880 [Rhinolophus ferrumequinum]|uniref:Uncharacterized protein n=1 Tax=Rhinolophus ferrumequinum TaxID=59479 RepID=A0A7J8AVT3_RHIFE|nr:hypothetical protein mRhiFer1_007880 [Rhinolophus ferrumequinum]
MEKDIVTHTDASTTQASSTDSAAAPEGALPAVQSSFEDSTLAASSGENVGQKSMGQGENDEMEKRSVFRMCPSVETAALCRRVTPGHVALQKANSRRNTGKKNSHKRRNRRKSEDVYLPWPLTLQTQVSSAVPVLGQTCVVGALPVANTGVNVVHENREPMGNGEKENVSVLTETCKVSAGALLPAASPVLPSPEGGSLADNGEIKLGKRNSQKGKNHKNKKIMASPWPLTVQAWASFTSPAQVQASFAGTSSSNIDEVNVEHGSRGQKGEIAKRAVATLYQSTQASAPGPTVALGQASLDGTPLVADSGINARKKHRWKRRNRKEKSDLAHPWPLTVQAWASFTTAGPVQTPLQDKSPASMVVNVGQDGWPQLENEEVTKFIIPWPVTVQTGAPILATVPGQAYPQGALFLEDMQTRRRPGWGVGEQVQSSAEQMVEPYQVWRHPERYLGHQNFWECTVMNFARQVDYCYWREICSQERMQALTLNGAHTHISTSMMGMQGPERERAESQTVYMGRWEGF